MGAVLEPSVAARGFEASRSGAQLPHEHQSLVLREQIPTVFALLQRAFGSWHSSGEATIVKSVIELY